MAKVFKLFLIIALFSFSIKNVFSQQYEGGDYSRIGKKCPDFTFTKVINHTNSIFSLSNLKGKAVILDFWTTLCIPCIETIPKLDSLQKLFGSELQVIPVAMQMDNRVKELFDRLVRTGKISKNILPAVLDTTLFKNFQTGKGWLGQYIWIDRDGIVRYYTAGKSDLSVENIRAFLQGGRVPALEKSTLAQDEKRNSRVYYNHNKPLLFGGNGGELGDFFFRSILVPADKNIRGLSYPYISASINPRMVQVLRASIQDLYEIAYGDTVNHYPSIEGGPTSYGKYWISPVLEVNDKQLLTADYETMENVYSYSLVVPQSKASSSFLQRAMQNDLQNYFGYQVSVETRIMPCWRITADKNVTLKLGSKGGEVVADAVPDHLFLQNAKMHDLIYRIWGMNQGEPPIIDETNISGTIDIKLDVNMKSMPDIRRGLLSYGLNLVQTKKNMKVIIIRNSQQK